MATKIRPSRRGNFDVTGTRLIELGVTFVGYDHLERCYIDVVIPPGVEAALEADPMIDIERDALPSQPRAPRTWSSLGAQVDLKDVGVRLSELRVRAGLDLQRAAALTRGVLSPDMIQQIEATGVCDVRQLIVLADLYGASLDKITGRNIAHGDRRR